MHKHHSHARSTPVTAALVRNGIIKRRSTRMGLNASIALTGHDRHKTSFNISAKAINLNMHGAAVQLHRELSVGSTINLQNKRGIQVLPAWSPRSARWKAFAPTASNFSNTMIAPCNSGEFRSPLHSRSALFTAIHTNSGTNISGNPVHLA